jgi:hypothetical protein
MAAHAVTHIEFPVLIDAFHCLNRPVALLALETSRQMRLVREMNVVRQVVDTNPLNRLAGIIHLSQLDNIGFVDRDHTVAVHAHIHRGNRGLSGTFGVGVTVKAGDVIIAGVELVAERQWLLGLVTLIAPHVAPHIESDDEKSDNKNGSADTATHEEAFPRSSELYTIDTFCGLTDSMTRKPGVVNYFSMGRVPQKGLGTKFRLIYEIYQITASPF